MAKIMLVEDDNNLREIYEARLQAEGYELVAAKDGEEALVLAKNEMPDLIISDVMMPKVSGFEMLDIIRNTEGLKEVKVIMLTALGQSDDQQRADRLGADRYLVKSQVTLEDIVKVAHELLNDNAQPEPTVVAEAATVSVAPTPVAVTDPNSDVNPATTDDTVTGTPPNNGTTIPVLTPDSDQSMPANDLPAQSSAQEEADIDAKIENFVTTATNPTPAPTDSTAAEQAIDANDGQVMSDAIDELMATTRQTPAAAVTVAPTAESSSPPQTIAVVSADDTAESPTTNGSVPIAHKKVISPLEASQPKPDLNALLALEEAKANLSPPVTPSAIDTSTSQPVVMSPLPVGDTAEPTPTTPEAETNPFNPIDPNHIAL